MRLGSLHSASKVAMKRLLVVLSCTVAFTYSQSSPAGTTTGCICGSTRTVYVDSTSTIASPPEPSSPTPTSTSSIYEVTSLPALTSTPNVEPSSSSLPPTATLIPSPGGLCGPPTGTSCVPGECCGAEGICGNNSIFCGNGCQIQFGNCSQAGRCGDYGDSQSCDDGFCCSGTGYCGQGDEYCGDTCQPAFGTCGTNFTSAVNSATSEAGCTCTVTLSSSTLVPPAITTPNTTSSNVSPAPISPSNSSVANDSSTSSNTTSSSSTSRMYPTVTITLPQVSTITRVITRLPTVSNSPTFSNPSIGSRRPSISVLSNFPEGPLQCERCRIVGGSISVATSEARATSTISRSTESLNVTSSEMVVSVNTTVYYSAIVSVNTLYAENDCGRIGRNYWASTLTLNATYGSMSVATGQEWMNICSVDTTAPAILDVLYLQILTVEPALLAKDPAWANCTTYLSGCYDPPRAYTSASVASGVTFPPQPGGSIRSIIPTSVPVEPQLTLPVPELPTASQPTAIAQSLNVPESESRSQDASSIQAATSSPPLDRVRPSEAAVVSSEDSTISQSADLTVLTQSTASLTKSSTMPLLTTSEGSTSRGFSASDIPLAELDLSSARTPVQTLAVQTLVNTLTVLPPRPTGNQGQVIVPAPLEAVDFTFTDTVTVLSISGTTRTITIEQTALAPQTAMPFDSENTQTVTVLQTDPSLQTSRNVSLPSLEPTDSPEKANAAYLLTLSEPSATVAPLLPTARTSSSMDIGFGSPPTSSQETSTFPSSAVATSADLTSRPAIYTGGSAKARRLALLLVFSFGLSCFASLTSYCFYDAFKDHSVALCSICLLEGWFWGYFRGGSYILIIKQSICMEGNI